MTSPATNNGTKSRRASGLSQGLGLHGHLIVLVLIGILPILAFAGILLFQFAESERHNVQRRVNERAQLIANVVDQEIDRAQALLGALASSPYLDSGDYAAFHKQARSIVPGPDQWIILFNRDRDQIVNTIRPLGTPLPKAVNAPAVMEVLRTGIPVVSDLVTGPVVRNPAVATGVPVIRNGETVGVLSITFPPAMLAGILADESLPSDWTVGLIDGLGTIITRTRAPKESAGQRAVPEVAAQIATGTDGPVTTRTLEGTAVYAYMTRLPLAGWWVIAGAPVTSLEAPWRRSLAVLLVGGGIILIVALILAAALGRNISAPVLTLARDAAALGRGEAPPARASGLREIDQVSEALANTAVELRERDDHLNLLLAELDHRARNMLAVVQATMRLTRGDDINGYRNALQGRIAALARAHSLLAQSRWAGASLNRLVDEELAPFRSNTVERIVTAGPDVSLAPAAAQTLAMIVHELATNSAKFGALSTPIGQVEADWRIKNGDAEPAGDPTLVLIWRETAAKPVSEPIREGFGLTMIRAGVNSQLAGTVDLDFAPGGLTARFTIPSCGNALWSAAPPAQRRA